MNIRFSSDGSGQSNSSQQANTMDGPAAFMPPASSPVTGGGPSTPKKRKPVDESSTTLARSPDTGSILNQLALSTPPSTRARATYQSSPSSLGVPEFKVPMTGSPFKGNYAASYQQSVQAIAHHLRKDDSASSSGLLAEAVVIADKNNLDLIRIREFIADFWSEEQNILATRAAYVERNRFQSEQASESQSFLEEGQMFLQQVYTEVAESKALLKADASKDNINAVSKAVLKLLGDTHAWNKNNADNIKRTKIMREPLKDIMDDIINSLSIEAAEDDDEENQLEALKNGLSYVDSTLQSHVQEVAREITSAKKKQKAATDKMTNISDPLCLSFAMVADKEKKRLFCLVSISSPEKNKALYQLLSAFIENSKYKGIYLLAESPSKDFQKMMNQIGGMLSEALPRHAYRECAEKSCISTLTKLSQHMGTELNVDSLYNLAFYPMSKQGSAANLLDVKVGENEFTVKLIPPCDDCKKRIPTDHLLLQSANSKMIVPSPLRQAALRQQSAAASSMTAYPAAFLARQSSRGRQMTGGSSSSAIASLSPSPSPGLLPLMNVPTSPLRIPPRTDAAPHSSLGAAAADNMQDITPIPPLRF